MNRYTPSFAVISYQFELTLMVSAGSLEIDSGDAQKPTLGPSTTALC